MVKNALKLTKISEDYNRFMKNVECIIQRMQPNSADASIGRPAHTEWSVLSSFFSIPGHLLRNVTVAKARGHLPRRFAGWGVGNNMRITHRGL